MQRKISGNCGALQSLDIKPERSGPVSTLFYISKIQKGAAAGSVLSLSMYFHLDWGEYKCNKERNSKFLYIFIQA